MTIIPAVNIEQYCFVFQMLQFLFLNFFKIVRSILDKVKAILFAKCSLTEAVLQ